MVEVSFKAGASQVFGACVALANQVTLTSATHAVRLRNFLERTL